MNIKISSTSSKYYKFLKHCEMHRFRLPLTSRLHLARGFTSDTIIPIIRELIVAASEQNRALDVMSVYQLSGYLHQEISKLLKLLFIPANCKNQLEHLSDYLPTELLTREILKQTFHFILKTNTIMYRCKILNKTRRMFEYNVSRRIYIIYFILCLDVRVVGYQINYIQCLATYSQ